METINFERILHYITLQDLVCDVACLRIIKDLTYKQRKNQENLKKLYQLSC